MLVTLTVYSGSCTGRADSESRIYYLLPAVVHKATAAKRRLLIANTPLSQAIFETLETRLTSHERISAVLCSFAESHNSDSVTGEMLGDQYPSLIGRAPNCTSPVPDENLMVVKWILRSCLRRTSNLTGTPLSMNGHETLMFGRGSHIVSIMTQSASFNSQPTSDGSSSQPAVWPLKTYARCERRNI